METPSKDEIEAFIKQTDSPAGNRYWVRQKREIMYKIFKPEILDQTLSLPITKVREAIAQLGEVSDHSMEGRVRAFVYRVRKERRNKSYVNKTESPVPGTSNSQEKRRTAPRRPHWTAEKREIIYKIFKEEILDLNSRLDAEKICQAVDELGEEQTRRNTEKVRLFVLRIRKERVRKINKGQAVSPLPSDTESGVENVTDSSESAPLLIESCADSGTVNQGELANDQSETKVDSGVDFESLICMNSGNVIECKAGSIADETKPGSVVHSSKEGNLDYENNNYSLKNFKEETKSDFVFDSLIENSFESGLFKRELENGQGERRCYPPASFSRRSSTNVENNGDTKENTHEVSNSDNVMQPFNENYSDSRNVEESEAENSPGETNLDFAEPAVNENCMDFENNNASRNVEEETKYNPAAESLIKDDMSSEYVNKSALEDGHEETKLDPDVQPFNETADKNSENNEHAPEIREEVMELDIGAPPLSENDAASVTNNDTSDNVEEATKTDCGMQSSIENEMVCENNDHAAGVDQEETKLSFAVRSWSEDCIHSKNNENVSEHCSEDTKCDPVVRSLDETVRNSKNTNGDALENSTEATKSDPAVVQSSNDIGLDSQNTNGEMSGNSDKDIKLDSAVLSSNENGTDCENINKGVLGNDEATSNLVTESLNESCIDFENSNNVGTFDNGGEETKFDPGDSNNIAALDNDGEETKCELVIQSLDKNHMDCENNEKLSVSRKRKLSPENDEEVAVSPKKKKTQWTSEMTSVMKNHFARELSKCNWPLETEKIDFMVNFLKSNGFDTITSEKVFAWANNQFNDGSELFSDQVIECLVAGVLNGNVDLESIVKLNLEQNEPPQSSSNELIPGKLNGTSDLPSEQPSSKDAAEENIPKMIWE